MFLSKLQRDEHFSSLKLKIWILVIFKAALALFPLQGSKLSNFKASSISKQFSVTKIQIFSFRENKNENLRS